MGTCLNPGSLLSQTAMNAEVFVDKSEMVSHLNSVVNTSQRFVCVSRPHRIGKTTAANMIRAHYGHEAGSRPCSKDAS